MSIRDLFKKFRSQPSINYCENFIFGYHDFFCAAFNTLNDLEAGKIEDFAAQCRILTTGNAQEIRERFQSLRHANYGYHYGTTYDKLDFKLLKQHSGDDFSAILAAGMMHSSGYCREECTNLIADYPEYLPLVIYGFNDWVLQVRNASEKSFFDMLSRADILTVVKAYSAANVAAIGERYDRGKLELAIKEMAEIIRQKNDIEIVSSIKTESETSERYKLYFPLLCSRLISDETVNDLIGTESIVIRDRLLITLISKYDLSKERLIELTKCRIPRVRYIAVRKLYERFGLWQDSERLLLDKSASVRGEMQYYFEKSGRLDLKSFYRENFPTPEAIKGFGECGVFADESEIKPFVSSENEKIAAAAIYAIYRLTADENDDLYYDMITDKRQQVSKAAFKSIHKCGNADPKTVYNDIMANRNDKITVKRLVKLLCHNTGSLWNAMPWFIRLYNTPEDHVKIPVRIAVSRRSYIYMSTREHAEEICRAMEENPLPEQLAKEIYREIGVIR